MIKKFEKFSTNQNAPFQNFEFGAKKGLKWKLMIHWFYNCRYLESKILKSILSDAVLSKLSFGVIKTD